MDHLVCDADFLLQLANTGVEAEEHIEREQTCAEHDLISLIIERAVETIQRYR